MRDELELAGGHAREPDPIRIRLGANKHAHRERDRGLRFDPDRRRCREAPAGSGRSSGGILADHDRATVREEERHHAIERSREDPLGVGDTDDRVRHLVDRADLIEVLALGALTFIERLGHRVERALERADLVRGSLRHAGRQIASLDPLRRGRQARERVGDASRRPVGEERDDPRQPEADHDQQRDEGALRLLDGRRRHQDREQTGVLPR